MGVGYGVVSGVGVWEAQLIMSDSVENESSSVRLPVRDGYCQVAFPA